MNKIEIQTEALDRARNGMSAGNYVAIVQGFTAKGIPEGDILPRENVFTYHAWRALGRQVRKDEHGVKVVTFVPSTRTVTKADGTEEEFACKRPWSATVFHVSQTDPTNGGAS